MRLILTNLRENHAEKGLDWIVLGANAVALCVVVLASSSGNPFEHADAPDRPPTYQIASID